VDLKGFKMLGCGMNPTGSGEGPITGFCEHDDEPLVYINVGNFLLQLRESESEVHVYGCT
jgi:hypothetical protein